MPIDAKPNTPRTLFDLTVTFEIPPFQRPYVWTEEDQWVPLWDDLKSLCERLGQLDAAGQATERHFLGALVLKGVTGLSPGEPIRWSVIDGQQRLTTLQLLLHAAASAFAHLGADAESEELSELVTNQAPRFAGSRKQLKLWPSRADEATFEQVMLGQPLSGGAGNARINEAHDFFDRTIRSWLSEGGAPDSSRIASLARALQGHLSLIAITIDPSDDDQEIFETLNGRGTPLLAADLVKNLVFQRCLAIGGDVDRWNHGYWKDFDDDWWRQEIAQGRLYRARVDLFLQYWLTMRLRSEVPAMKVFGTFRDYSRESLKTIVEAESSLLELRADADLFRRFAELDPKTPKGSFYSRVIEALELGAFIPLFLRLISVNRPVPDDQAAGALLALESWAVRRTLLRRTMKDVNRFVVELLGQVDSSEPASVAGNVTSYLASQTADSRTWPTDAELAETLPSLEIYGNVKQQRLRAVLSAVELHLRRALVDDRGIQSRLDIEHVMPQGWRTHWNDGAASDEIASMHRDRIINTIGNLTLTTKALNLRLSNRPWTDQAAASLDVGDEERGLGKRSLLDRYSLMELKRDIVTGHEAAWTEEDIARRSRALADVIARVWPRP